MPSGVGATAATAWARRRGRRAARALGTSRTAHAVARGGLAARTVFYLVLVYITAQIAARGGQGGRQANAHGALSVIARDPLGRAAIVAAAAGFFGLGAVRLAGAVRDRRADTWRRVTTGLQGAFYLALTYVPLSFVLGRRSTGSEQSQHSETATILAWPAGQEIVALIGLIIVVVCGWQVRGALTRDFTDGMDLAGRAQWVRRLVEVTGLVGIGARALVFLPIGVLLIVAAVQFDPRHADGLDRELATLAGRSWWGPAVLAAVAAGLAVFAAYSGLEARFRNVGKGE